MKNNLKKFILVYLTLLQILLLLSRINCLDQDPPIALIQSNTLFNQTFQSWTPKYYQININSSNIKQKDVLIITVNQYNYQDSFIGIYISTNQSNHYPNYNNYNTQCYYLTLDSCGINLKNYQTSQQTLSSIYFSVQVSTQGNYSLQFTTQQYLQVKKGQSYKVNFNQAQSQVLILPYSQFLDKDNKPVDLIFLASYDTLKNAGKFQMLAGLNDLPSSDNTNTQTQAETIGAFRRILKLSPPQNQSSTYYILIQGQNGTQITVKTWQSKNIPQINQTYYDLINQNQTYVASIQNQNQSSTIPLFVTLNAYQGHGMFQIDYCNGQSKYTYQNLDGSNGQILIAVSQRKKCFDSLDFLVGSDKQIKVQTVSINVYDIAWKFGFSISVQQGTHTTSWRNEQKWYGVMSEGMQPRVYTLNYVQKLDQSVKIICENVTGIFQFTLYQCPKKKQCNQNNQNLIKLNISQQNQITIDKKKKYELNIVYIGPSQEQSSGDNNASKQIVKQGGQYTFEIIYQNSQNDSTLLTTGRIQFNAVGMNQYRYYYIDTSNLGPLNSTLLTLILTNANGQAYLMYSPTEQKPNFTMIYDKEHNVSLAWDGMATFQVNQNISQFIYLAVMGDTQALYHLQMVVDTNADLPTRYQTLIQGTYNNVIIQSTQNKAQGTAYLKYASHSIPYSISFSPMPNCIKYSSKLPVIDNKNINQSTCMTLPQKFYEKIVYFHVTQSNIAKDAPYKFNAYVNVGQYVLQPQKPVFISCQKSCYELIKVKIQQKQVNITKQGYGFLSIAYDENSKSVYNYTYRLKCQNPPCQITLNASLQYGGQMYLSFQTDQAQQIRWWSQSMMWSLDKPKHLYFKLLKNTLSKSFVIYADGLTPSIYLNIFPIKDTLTNLIDYTYPSQSKYQLKYQSDPTRRIQLVNINNESLKSLGCLQQNVYCVVTVSVYVNKSILFNQEYLNYGLGYFSTNDYDYYIEVDRPYHITEQYSLSHFVVIIPPQSLSQNIRVSLQALSNCRPYISYDNSQTVSYRDALIPIKAQQDEKNNFRYARFSVVSNFMCKYYLTASQLSYQSIIPNVLYSKNLQMKDQSSSFNSNASSLYTQMFVYQHTLSSSGYQIVVENLNRHNQNQSMTILATQIFSNTTQSQIQSFGTNSYSYQKTFTSSKDFLYVNCTRYSKWIIKTTSPTVNLANFMVRQSTYPIQLIHNQQQSYTFTDDATNATDAVDTQYKVQYIYHTASSFKIFMTLSAGQVQLNVYKMHYQNRTKIKQKYILDYSDPWTSIQNTSPGNRLSTFVIVIQSKQLGNDNTTTITLHTEQQDMRGSLRLYDGVMLIDSFVNFGSKNCYTYYSQKLVGRLAPIVLDFSYLNKTIQYNSIYSQDLYRKVTSTVSINKGFVQSTSSLLNSNTLRSQAQYLFNTQYTFCFALTQQSLVGKQYYIVISSPGLEHLPIGYELNYIQPSEYNLLQIINPQRKTKKLLVKAINCSGNLEVMSSSNFYEAQLGRVAHIHQQWQNQDSYYGLVDVNSGYFYLGLKSYNYSRYQIVSQWVGQNYKITASQWKLGSKKIVDTSQKDNNLVIDLPKIANIKGTSDKLQSIQYIVTIINLTQLSQKLKQTDFSKCVGILNKLAQQQVHNDNLNTIMLTKQDSLILADKKSDIKYLNISYTLVVSNPHNQATFKIPLDQLPSKFNISGQAKVKLVNDSNTLSYFYEPKTYTKKQQSPFMKIVIIVALVSGFVILVGSAGFIYRQWQIRKKNRVQFELNQQKGKDEDNGVQMKQSNVSYIKPLNENAGYGQFVDQTS